MSSELTNDAGSSPNSGMIADAVLTPDENSRAYAWGSRAAKIRQLSLRYPELNKSQLARMVGCSHQNVSEVLAEFLADSSPEHLEDYRANKPSIFEAVQYRLLASVTQDKMDNQSALQLITGAAILQDKIQVLRGQPTSIHVHALVDVLEALRGRDDE